MPARVFSIEDGNTNTQSINVARTRQDIDIDLSFSAKFVGTASDGSNIRGDVFKKNNLASVKQAIRNLLQTNYTERPFMHRFGGNLSALLFRLSTEVDDLGLEDDIVSAVERFEPRAKILNINIGTGKGTSVLELAKTFEKVNKCQIPIIFSERRNGDIPFSVADNSLALETLDWVPKRNIDEMCRDGWKWLEENPNGYQNKM